MTAKTVAYNTTIPLSTMDRETVTFGDEVFMGIYMDKRVWIDLDKPLAVKVSVEPVEETE